MPINTVLSICTGAGLLDRAFLDEGFSVIPVAEIDPVMRAMYASLNGGEPLVHDLNDAPEYIADSGLLPRYLDGVIGGPPCQSRSKMRSFRSPKFPDLTCAVNRLLNFVKPRWYMFENVVPIDIPGASWVRLDAMHYHRPHQSRPRWFTCSPNIAAPPPVYHGTVDDLVAYPIVMGRVYGPKRGAVLQGYPAFADLLMPTGKRFPCKDLQLGLANAVAYPLARAWARAVAESVYT